MTEDKLPENVLDTILLIETIAESKIKEKGSLFIGQVHPVNNEPEFISILNGIRKKYYDATHHCYAYKLLDGKFKYSDDGEPNGTAGIRLFNAIEHFKLLNVAVFSIRYYGGTKLGVGPLGKAYYLSAEEAIKSARIIEKKAYLNLSIILPHNLSKSIFNLINKNNAKIKSTGYIDEKMELKILSPFSGLVLLDELNKFKPHINYAIEDKIDYC